MIIKGPVPLTEEQLQTLTHQLVLKRAWDLQLAAFPGTNPTKALYVPQDAKIPRPVAALLNFFGHVFNTCDGFDHLVAGPLRPVQQIPEYWKPQPDLRKAYHILQAVLKVKPKIQIAFSAILLRQTSLQKNDCRAELKDLLEKLVNQRNAKTKKDSELGASSGHPEDAQQAPLTVPALACPAEEAEPRANKAKTRAGETRARPLKTNDAEARAEVAEARAEEATTKAEEVEARTSEAEARAAPLKTEDAVARADEATTRAEEAEVRAEEAETKVVEGKAQMAFMLYDLLFALEP
ncbi:hypothetical protein IscW_ISCW001777 [Ixodes scapularis]|uniref:Uncharacterized protein n=1 Tax=Ixodes scapularis TaxID=6945 RepID=B7P0V9_IXOSC|nr:hypothetical protein IscW_ISCW001777 [Ixodes scapularis]|eukprot:XP_002399404.1 hypothetical protein IscW_ISCW001777 [Ixodes scapularis]